MIWGAALVLALAGLGLLLARLSLPGWILWVLAALLFGYGLAVRSTPPAAYNFGRVLREYSLGISNIVDPKALATVAIGLINEALELQSGYLFLVSSEMNETGKMVYRLRGWRGMGEDQPLPGQLANNSPVAERLSKARSPLTQQELDHAPAFQTVLPEERQWLTELKVSLFVPIYTKEEWNGLLALGPKASGAAYTPADLDLLTTLADLTAVALKNARLMESLGRLNNEYRRTYAIMERNNRYLERVDRTKSDFISIASHELRTPISVIRGYSEILMEEPTIKENAYHAKMMTGIHTGVIRMHEIVDSMLDMASIDTKSLELTPEAVTMSVLIKLIGEGLRSTLTERKLSLVVDESLRAVPPVKGDSEALRKVFTQLLMNAIKYTPDGGTITVRGQELPGDAASLPDGGVEVIVSDTGIGIAPDIQELIFAKFYQTGKLTLHSTGKTKFKGSGPGLGLAIAKGIVEAHAGRIWVESAGYDEEKCPGSHFHVVLPVKK